MDCNYPFPVDFITKPNSIWCKIYQKRVITIYIWFGSTRFGEDSSVCAKGTFHHLYFFDRFARLIGLEYSHSISIKVSIYNLSDHYSASDSSALEMNVLTRFSISYLFSSLLIDRPIAEDKIYNSVSYPKVN